MDDKVIAKREPQACFILNNIIYLPHYTMPDYFVAPGMNLDGMSHDDLVNNLYTVEDLVQMGAIASLLPLWPRTSMNIVPFN